METAMTTVNFSVPDDVKAAKLTQRRRELFRSLTESRSRRPSLSDAELRAIRRSGRP